MLYSVKAHIDTTHYTTQVSTPGGHQLIADEPESIGGANKGFSPDELLSAALATCSAMTMRMYADRKKWPLETLTVDVDYSRDNEKVSSKFFMKITITGNLDEEQKERLRMIASKCPIHQTLVNPVNIQIISN